MTSSSDIMFSKNDLQLESIQDSSLITCNRPAMTLHKSVDSNKYSLGKLDKDVNQLDAVHVENTEVDHFIKTNNYKLNQNTTDDVADLSIENIEENYKHNISANNFEESFENKNEVVESNVVCRHGSGDTYTKFTEDPADLEEFLQLTDKLIQSNNGNHLNETNLAISLENIQTPQTSSLESINEQTEYAKRDFSDTLQELKSDLKDLLQGARDQENDVDVINNGGHLTDDSGRNVSDMEHITVYQLKFYEGESNTDSNSLDKISSELKLPAINKTNKFTLGENSSRNPNSKIYKGHKKYKLFGQQNKTDNEYRTFIIKKKQEDNSDEEPPLKLPRIDIKRLDDTYDPFVSAARQMKELMSSDTNIPKKVHNISKDPNRTLPSLRPVKDKQSTPHLRSDNSKKIKDTINKTYQKTPTLQRMKSFGSTNNDNSSNSFGGRCNSFRLNRNDKKGNQKLNTTFTKSSKENISTTEKSYFSRSSNLNRSFSSYSNSSYSTPKLKDKIPKISQSMHHGFQRNTTKQPLKLDKINKNEGKKDFINLNSLLSFDNNTSMTDSNYIDPRLINENDNLPINVNTIFNNPDIISSMESLLTTENLPAKFESFSAAKNNHTESNNMTDSLCLKVEKNNNLNLKKNSSSTISDFSSKYDKMMSSIEQSIASKTSVRDDDSLCEDFDLEEFMISFDEEVHKQKPENMRICSSTTRVVASDMCNDVRGSETKVVNSPKVVNSGSNGFIPVNKSTSLIFSSNNVVGDKLFPSSVKRSMSLLDSIQ
ncbi:jg22254, partial [Pararge aegeria aegeria]